MARGGGPEPLVELPQLPQRSQGGRFVGFGSGFLRGFLIARRFGGGAGWGFHGVLSKRHFAVVVFGRREVVFGRRRPPSLALPEHGRLARLACCHGVVAARTGPAFARILFAPRDPLVEDTDCLSIGVGILPVAVGALELLPVPPAKVIGEHFAHPNEAALAEDSP